MPKETGLCTLIALQYSHLLTRQELQVKIEHPRCLDIGREYSAQYVSWESSAAAIMTTGMNVAAPRLFSIYDYRVLGAPRQDDIE